MKDKSRLISSVIVSLLAGFTYYQFGQGIEQNFESTFKKAFTSVSEEQQYRVEECLPLTTLISTDTDKTKKKKSKFFLKKRNTIEIRKNNETIPGDELFTALVGQAKFKKPAADRNVDFTAELQQLVASDLTEKTPSRSLKSFKDDSGIADVTGNTVKTESVNKNIEKEYRKVYGYGFEYNEIIITTERAAEREKKNSGCEYNSNSNNKNSKGNSNGFNSSILNEGLQFEVNVNTNTVRTERPEKRERKIKVVVPKIHVKIITKSTEPVEISIPEETDCEDSM